MRPLLIGHRGAPGYRPEHTRSSYELALSMGVDAVEPDVVFTRDGVAVVRHENEIGSTTDVAAHPGLADRRTTRVVDGEELTGWFTDDLTWDELATLRCRERIPRLRPASAVFDDTEPPLRLRDVLDLVHVAAREQRREIGVVVEIKHATYFEARGIDVAGAVAAELRAAGWGAAQTGGALPLVIESFEQTVLARVRDHGIRASFVYLLEDAGRPADLVAALGEGAPTYADQRMRLDALAGEVDGISLDKATILRDAGIVAAAHARGLRVFTWTCRPENAFLSPPFRRGDDPAAFGDYEAEWRAIADAGVDGVFVDHPDLGAALFR
ncbi:glycerophosphodiester phosphodiesterase family protein [Microbacterium sp. No. 7]|uniref:glycerophosphodiester phosphodiesterase family protein n=1 Tax=Microbacterium sp. No. 7 TaxID=1714373 RepID=UPI0006D13A9F|nr:glycerophosphodiester phosphodiesterase family protein [Microbacterium sp. No. 7]ALJ19136.1 glycerophosphodiester phosphodiesterase [Microbacterium sp. No. 7]